MSAVILVTAAGGDIGSDILRCLAGRPETRLACDADPYAAGRALADGFFPCPPAREEQAYLEFLESAVRSRGVTLLCPASEAEMAVVDRHRGRLEHAGLRLLLHPAPLLNICLDKFATAKFLLQRGLPTPRTEMRSSFAGGIPFPVVLKPRRGCGSSGVSILRDAEELARHPAEDMVVQEMVGSPEEEYTAGLFSDGQETRTVVFRRRLGFGSLSRQVTLVQYPEADRMLRRLAQALDLRGSINVQMRRRGEEFVVFEINPRISSTAHFRHRLGFQDVHWWVDLALGRKPEAYRQRFDQAVGVRTLSNVFFDLRPTSEWLSQETLLSDRLILRPLVPDDVTEDYVEGLNDPEVNRFLVEVRRRHQTKESVRAFVAAHLAAGNDRLFGIFLKDAGSLIGTVRLHGIDAGHRIGVIGICVFKRDAWGKGYGSEAVERVSRSAFEKLGLRYLEAGSYAENPGSIRLFLKAGYQETARFKDKYLLDGRPAEVVLLGLKAPTAAAV